MHYTVCTVFQVFLECLEGFFLRLLAADIHEPTQTRKDPWLWEKPNVDQITLLHRNEEMLIVRCKNVDTDCVGKQYWSALWSLGKQPLSMQKKIDILTCH